MNRGYYANVAACYYTLAMHLLHVEPVQTAQAIRWLEYAQQACPQCYTGYVGMAIALLTSAQPSNVCLHVNDIHNSHIM